MTSRYTPSALTALTLPAGGRLLVGHVSAVGLHDPSVPIPAHQYDAPCCEDATCHHCPAHTEVSLSEDGSSALLLVIHRGGCPELAVIRGLVKEGRWTPAT